MRYTSAAGADGSPPVGIKQTIGHPAALLDADGDGLLDVLLAGPDRVTLFRNLGSWRFRETPEAGFRQKGYWQGVAVGDVDRDGHPDVYLSGFGTAALYLNQGGGRFRDVTAPSGLGGIDANRWLTSAAFADVDGDGWLDLYVTAYVELGDRTGVCLYPGGITTACAPMEFAPQRGTLYRNLGTRPATNDQRPTRRSDSSVVGRSSWVEFRDVTTAFGLQNAHGNGLGVAFGDPDNDGDPDLYLANDQRPCDLYVNEGGRRFVNRGEASGTAFGRTAHRRRVWASTSRTITTTVARISSSPPISASRRVFTGATTTDCSRTPRSPPIWARPRPEPWAGA